MMFVNLFLFVSYYFFFKVLKLEQLNYYANKNNSSPILWLLIVIFHILIIKLHHIRCHFYVTLHYMVLFLSDYTHIFYKLNQIIP